MHEMVSVEYPLIPGIIKPKEQAIDCWSFFLNFNIAKGIFLQQKEIL
jgi:hypothetical protein